MLDSPFQNVPSTPQIFQQPFSTKQCDIICFTPEQTVPKTPLGLTSRYHSEIKITNRTCQITPTFSPLAKVPNLYTTSISTPTVKRNGILCMTKKINSKYDLSSHCASEIDPLYLKNTYKDTSKSLLNDFQIVPEIAWVDGDIAINVEDETEEKCNMSGLLEFDHQASICHITAHGETSESFWG